MQFKNALLVSALTLAGVTTAQSWGESEYDSFLQARDASFAYGDHTGYLSRRDLELIEAREAEAEADMEHKLEMISAIVARDIDEDVFELYAREALPKGHGHHGKHKHGKHGKHGKLLSLSYLHSLFLSFLPSFSFFLPYLLITFTNL